jgi:hypothetical protein
METSDTAGREESTIVVREHDAATTQLAPQNHHLMSELLSLKPDLRLEQRGQDGQDETR